MQAEIAATACEQKTLRLEQLEESPKESCFIHTYIYVEFLSFDVLTG